VAEHTRLTWLLECVATMGELDRMTQFKEKSAGRESVGVGLHTYPVLMSADILLYDADRVPVGDDQRQHLELARELAIRFNHRYGETFVVPEAAIPAVGARVMDLQHPTRKMSKSVSSPLGTVGMLDAPEEITRKIKKAVTDTDGEVRYDWEKKPGITNLLEIYSSFSNDTPQAVAERYTRYGDLKKDLAALIIESLEPIHKRYDELLADPVELRAVVARGAVKASAVAGEVYRRAAQAIGLI
jgi:tryptophanyl-tRNA synthetase